MKKRERLRHRVDPVDLDKQTAEVNDLLEREAEKRNAIVAYLEQRKHTNGFGADFEYTLKSKRA